MPIPLQNIWLPISLLTRLNNFPRFLWGHLFLFFLFLHAFPSPSYAEKTTSGTNRWEILTPATQKRTEVSAASIKENIYIVGGFDEPGIGNLHHYTVSNTLEVYNSQTHRWTMKASLPIFVHHAGAVALGNFLYVIGGFSPSLFSIWSPVDTLFKYDPMTDTWMKLTPMPTKRGALAAAVLHGKIYVVGGIAGGKNSNAVEIYDPQTDSWQAAPSLPTPRDHLVAVTVQGQLFAIGGRLEGDYGKNLGIVEIYDSANRTWKRGVPLPTPRSGMAAAVIGEVIYVVGGESPEGTFSTNEAYLPSRGIWKTMEDMPTARHGLGVTVIHNELYAIAGGPTPGGSYSNVMERFTPQVLHPLRQTIKRAASSHVGSVMALLATLETSQVLPPENSPNANKIVQALIQFQSAFMKSSHPAVMQFLAKACEEKFGPRSSDIISEFRGKGWTSKTLEALVDYDATHMVWTPTLIKGFTPYNMKREDFKLMARIYTLARASFIQRRQDIHQVYAQWRRQMPGVR